MHQASLRIPVAFPTELPKGPDGHLAGDFTTPMTTQTVGDDQQNLARLGIIETIEGVLVDPSDPADVRRARDCEFESAPVLSALIVQLVRRLGIPSLSEMTTRLIRACLKTCPLSLDEARGSLLM